MSEYTREKDVEIQQHSTREMKNQRCWFGTSYDLQIPSVSSLVWEKTWTWCRIFIDFCLWLFGKCWLNWCFKEITKCWHLITFQTHFKTFFGGVSRWLSWLSIRPDFGSGHECPEIESCFRAPIWASCSVWSRLVPLPLCSLCRLSGLGVLLTASVCLLSLKKIQ